MVLRQNNFLDREILFRYKSIDGYWQPTEARNVDL